MPVTVTWFNHASFRLADDDAVVYIDPWKISGRPADGDLVLVSHSHHDHLSTGDVQRVSAKGAIVLGPPDVAARLPGARAVTASETVRLRPGLAVRGVAAYNVGKKFHPKANGWLGWLVELGGKHIYYAGDTDLIGEMNDLGPIDLALLPVGGTYTMDAEAAVQAVGRINPARALPYHWGDIVGGRSDADRFARALGEQAVVLDPGGSLTL